MVTLTTCGAQPDYVTRHGLAAYLNSQPGPSKDEVEAATEIVISVLVDRVGGAYSRSQLEHQLDTHWEAYTLVVHPGNWFECAGSPTGKCAGQFHPYYRTIEVTHERCVAVSALAHELLHFFNWLIEGRVDSEHSNPTMFATACAAVPAADRGDCMRHSVENLSNIELCRQFCPELGCH
jgi:hypothetical protein